MSFSALRAAYEEAKNKLEQFTGGRDFPGLGRHDRVYELPPDVYGWSCHLIVRFRQLSELTPHLVPVEVYVWRNGLRIAPPDEMTPAQHEAIANIKRTVSSWVLGAIKELPPSTSKHCRRDDEV